MSKSSQSLIVPLLSTTEKSTDFYLKLPTKREQQNWNRKEKYVWFFTLLFGVRLSPFNSTFISHTDFSSF